MPTSLTYPGVYIEELSSGVHTITGVATSIAAFIGWAAQGPADQATLVGSWGDFQTQFGGLNSNSYLGYSVNQFFANGGQQAYIVRLVAVAQSGTAATATTPAVAATTAPTTATATAIVQVGASNTTPPTTVSYSMDLAAANPGSWGNSITVSVSGPINTSRFGLQVSLNNAVVENFVNLSFDSSDPQYVFTVINNDSQYITLVDQPTTLTTLTSTTSVATLKGGDDGTPLHPGDVNFEAALWTTARTGGLYLLDRVEIFNLLCVPGETEVNTIFTLQNYCAARRAFFIMDASPTINLHSLVENGPNGYTTAPNAANSAFYFPWVLAADPLFGNRPSTHAALRFCGWHLRRHRCIPGRVEGARRNRRRAIGRSRPSIPSHRRGDRRSEYAGRQLPAQLQGLRQRGLGCAHITGKRSVRVAMEICSDTASRTVHRVQSF